MAVPTSVDAPKKIVLNMIGNNDFTEDFMEAATGNNLSTVLELVFFFGLFANWIIYSLWMIWFDKQVSRKPIR